MKKRLLSAILSIVMLLTLFPVSAFAANSGNCGAQGNNLTWTLDGAGALTISGTGKMQDYENVENAPWYGRRDDITSLQIGSGVTSLSDGALFDCQNLESVTVGRSVTSIGNWIYQSFSSLTTFTVDADNSVYSSLNGVLFNKAKTTLVRYPVADARTDYAIPDSVQRIGYSAFRNCDRLTAVAIPASVTDIDDRAFFACRNLTDLTLSPNLTRIGNDVFENCEALTDVTIPSGVTSIGDYAFCGCYCLESVAIPLSMASIGEYAFAWSDAITDVYYAGTETQWNALCQQIGSENDCLLRAEIHFDAQSAAVIDSGCCGGEGDGTNLTWTLDENGLLTITGTGAMASDAPWSSYSNQITGATIGNGVTIIGGQAFRGYTSLTSVTIPNSVTIIGGQAFRGCTSLTSITIPGSVTAIGGNGAQYGGGAVFMDCTSLTSIMIPDSVTEIAEGSFKGCTSLTSVTIPNSVTSIGGQAFLGCSSLTSVTIPNSVTSIGGRAFFDCSSLTDVYYSGTKTQWYTLKKNIGSNNSPLLNATIHFGAAPVPQKHRYTIVPMPFGDLSVNVSGTATAYFRVEENGVPQPGVMLNYTLNGVAHSAVSDGNGLVAVTTPYVTKDTTFSVTFSPRGTDTLNNTLFNFTVTAKKLSYTQTWKGKLKTELEAGLSAGAGASVGAAEASAKLLEVSGVMNASGAITISDSYDDVDRTLQLDYESALGGGLEVKSGIDAGALGSAKINVIGSKAGVSDTYSTTRGLKLEHYDPKNVEQNLSMGKYLLYPIMSIDHSVLTQKILSLVDSKVCDVSGSKNSVVISAKVGIGEVEIGEYKGSLAGGNQKVVWSWENTADYTEDTLKTKKSFQSAVGAGLGASIGWKEDVGKGEDAGKFSLGSYVFGKTLSNNKEISATHSLKDNEVQSVSYKSYSDVEADIMWGKASKDTYATVTFSGDDAKALLNANPELSRFVQGENPFIDQQSAIDYMGSSGLTANIKETTKSKTGVDIPIPFKWALGVSAGVEAEISGEHSYSYSNKTGVLYQNNSYVTSVSEVTTAQVEGQSKSLGDIITDPIAAVWDSIKDGVTSVLDSIADGIESGLAWVKKTGSKWYGKITSVFGAELQSYGVLTLMSADEPITNAAVSATLGEAYLVELYKDKACTEPVTDEELAESPVTLTLSYNAQMLAQAGAPADADVVLLRMDREKNMYIYEAGGVQDKANMCVTAEVTKNGEYILAVDSLAPIVTDFAASDQTDTPTLSALVSDLSGLRTFRFWLDDGADLVTEEDLADYYNAYTGEFTYTVTDALTPGEHTAHFLASDKLGNENTGSVDFAFEVRQMSGEIVSVEVPWGTVTTPEAFPVIVSTEETDDITAVGLACYVQEEQVAYYRLERSGESWQTNVFPIAGAEEMSLIATAYDGFGNTQSYEPVTVLMDVPAQEQGISITDLDCEIDGDTLNVFITAHNSTQNAASGTVMAAAYDADGRMLTVSSAGIGLLPDDDGMVELTMTENIRTAATVKVFLLDPSGNFVPQCQVIEEWTN